MKTSAKKSTPTRKKPAKANGVKYPDIQKDLEGQRAAILAEAGVVLTNPTGLEVFPDVSDQASAEADQHFSLRIRERERKLLPQGGVISPLLANLFLHYAFDKWMGNQYPHLKFVRYADDIVVHCGSQEEAEKSPR